MDLHPLCPAFPRMDDDAFAALKADIQANGLQQPVITLDGQILDGAHRYRACTELGIEPYLDEYIGKDPVAFVISANLHRRHMTASQSAMVAASLANLGNGQKTSSADLQSTPITQPQAAAMLHVSPRSVATATKVLDQGCENLVEAVKAGSIAVSKAAQIAALPKEQQPAAMAAPRPKPTKTRNEPPPEQPDDDLEARYADLVGICEREVAENAELRERIAALTADNLKAEIDRRVLEIQGLRGRLQQEMTTRSEAEKMARRRGILLEQIRKALEVERDSEILPAIEVLKGGAA